MFITVLWWLWKWRNSKIFKDSKKPLKSILHHIVSIHDAMPLNQPKLKKDRKKEVEIPLNSVPCAFFFGAEQNNICGCGVHVIMDKNLQYFLSWSCGNGSAWLKRGLLQDCLLSVCFLIFKTFQFMVIQNR